MWYPIQPSDVSSSEHSTSEPTPSASRLRRAASTPSAIKYPDPMSTTDPPTRTGGPSGWPVIDMIPLYACSSGSYPGVLA